jgi:hypothetical protein
MSFVFDLDWDRVQVFGVNITQKPERFLTHHVK